ncbi:MAG: DUF1054 domain-containing protein [Sulfobacillus acidophilus]|uniref:DUF1054 domain-containing protein n=1 Tax=Sulfobacillus acidophilus TaxID=53633 RepID=A0A2T2WM78_9FIRM|nr:MAG: DUF1054 domain-containing protein [Sulfobacillus acidophilus]
MYQFSGFSKPDFDVFLIPEFHVRMSALRTTVRPKLAMLGDDLAPLLAEVTGHAMYPHTASHARRRVNPPDDTWVAFSRSERGYKRYAHFEVGIFLDGVFVRFSIKPEGGDDKQALLQYLAGHQAKAFDLKDAAPIYYYANDHGINGRDIRSLTVENIPAIIQKASLKTHGFSVGMVFDRDQAVVRSAELVTRAHNAIRHLAPLYVGTMAAQVQS